MIKSNRRVENNVRAGDILRDQEIPEQFSMLDLENKNTQ